MDNRPTSQAIGFHAMNADVAVIGIFTILIFFVLHLTYYFFAPVLSAIVIGLLLSPVANRMNRRRIPRALTAAVLVLAALAGLALIIVSMIQPLTHWIDRAPLLWYKMRVFMDALEEPLANLKSFREGVRQVVGAEEGLRVQADPDSDVAQVATAVPALVGQVLIFVGALYFYLAGMREIKGKIVSLYSRRGDQLRVARLLVASEYCVSYYLARIAVINATFGVIVGLAMWAIGLPEAVLWGALAFALNFIPYLGPAVMTILIFLASVLTFHDFSTPFLAAGTYVILNLMEGQFVTPSIIGRTSELNPFLVFLCLAFGLWFWGAIGAFLAMPILLIGREVAVHSRSGGHAQSLRFRTGRR